jgi:hypothetical protein
MWSGVNGMEPNMPQIYKTFKNNNDTKNKTMQSMKN